MGELAQQHESAIFDPAGGVGGCPVPRVVPGSAGASRGDTAAADDRQLLHRYVQSRCPEAFGTLVARHIGWVESVVRRQVKDRHLAEDVTQAVFIILARKAHTIPAGTLLSAWLFRVARYAANDAVKHESRHRRRLERIAEMRTASQRGGSTSDTHVHAAATTIEPELDGALACLSDADRRVILLRFYEDKSMAELGIALGISEDAAKQRVSRALKRLRDQLQRKGIKAATVTAILSLLLRSSGTAKAAALARGTSLLEFTKVATGQTEAAGRSLQVAQATLKTIAAAHVRLLAALTGAGLVLTMAVGIFTPVLGQILHPLLDDVQSALTWSNAPSGTFHESSNESAPVATASEQTITKLWVGNSNEWGWPLLPRSGARLPIELRTISGANTPVAVAEDDQGQLWFRHIQPSQMSPAPTGDELRFRDYEELNPYLAVMPDESIVQLLPPNGSWVSNEHVSTDGTDWKPLEQISEGGRVVLPFSPLNPGLNGDFSGQIPTGLVPEPTGFLLATVGAAVQLRRRRRRVGETARRANPLLA